MFRRRGTRSPPKPVERTRLERISFRNTLLYYKGEIPTFEARKTIALMSLRSRRSRSGRPPWRRPSVALRRTGRTRSHGRAKRSART
eukprot:scaffold277_cov273-Pavlova_lutheri.AAC.1